MGKQMPLLKLFPGCTVQGRLRAAAETCTVHHVVVHTASRALELSVRFSTAQDPDVCERLGRSLCRAYGLQTAHLRLSEAQEATPEAVPVRFAAPEEEIPAPEEYGYEPPVPSEEYGYEPPAPPEEYEYAPPPEEPAVPAFAPSEPPVEWSAVPVPEEAPPESAYIPPEPVSAPVPEQSAAPAVPETPEEVFQRTAELRRQRLRSVSAAAPAHRAKKSVRVTETPSEILFGKRIRGHAIPMSDLSLDLGVVCVTGRIFADNTRDLKKRNACVVSFDITDNTNSVTVSKFLENKEAEPLRKALKKGTFVTVEGKLSLSRFTGDMELTPYAIAKAPAPPQRTDTAPEKRVELHLHTRFSTMDALTEVKDAVKRAIAWGHKAIAVTDHGVAQAFPDACAAAGDKIKVIYGTEAYYVNDVDESLALRGECADDSFDQEIVCFDLETTGLSFENDLITEIGAVLLKNGEIVDKYSTFVNPGRPIPRKIVELTSITDEMVKDAPGQEEALNDFLDWVGDRLMAAHNASFDMGMLKRGCERIGRPFHNPSLDTLVLAQRLLPDLRRHKLDMVTKRLGLQDFHHHRACDDAAMVGYMLPPFWQMLRDMGVNRFSDLNARMRTLHPGGKRRQKRCHLIVLAKNQTGLRNLYKLISLAHLEHYQVRPVMPKSLIDESREGLILGSACEAGELFQAVVEHREWNELLRIASWYDFLEIQPLCNNSFMLRNGLARDEEELREFNRTIVRLGKALHKPVCATGDVHFLDPEQEIFRHILLAFNGFDSADDELPIYFKTTDEMLEEFAYLGEADCKKVVVDDPNRIARWCDPIKPLPKGLFAPKLKDSAKELEFLVYDKAHKLYGEHLPQIVQDRIDLELPGIIQRKYDVIYMSAQKLVHNSLEHGYLVGSRGSVGSSIVAFLSGITEVNSLPPHYRCPKCQFSDFDVDQTLYGCGADLPDRVCPVCGEKLDKDGFNIPFETFLGYGGTKVPDIDLNFSGEYQAKAHRYTFELFGEGHVFKAGTVGTVAEKTAYGFVLKYLEQREKHVSRAEEARLALGCTNVKRTTGQHPGGMVVIPGDKEIYDFCPVQHPADDPNSDIITTHFEYHSMESNLLKLDMLGHDDPTMIRMLQDLTGVDPRTIPLDDRDTMSLFCSSKAMGFEDDPVLGPTGAVAIPEFGTPFTRQMLIDTQPKNFNTLLRLSGFSHGTDVWLGNAKDLILSGTASVEQAIGCRDDIMLYLIAQGCEPLHSFKFMEAVRKGVIHKGKSWPDGIEQEMQEHGIPQWYIESCRKIKYLFPKAHAVAYVMMAFRIAYFKVHDPLAFYATYFSIRAKAVDATCMFLGMETVQAKMKEIKEKEKTTDVEDKMYTTLEVCYEMYLRGFTFKKMDLMEMQATRFGVDRENKALIPCLTSIPGLGEAAAEATVEAVRAREGRPFISVEEVAGCCNKLSETHLKTLRYMGALDGLPETSQITFF